MGSPPNYRATKFCPTAQREHTRFDYVPDEPCCGHWKCRHCGVREFDGCDRVE